jgi:hypothetical protein
MAPPVDSINVTYFEQFHSLAAAAAVVAACAPEA